MASGIALTRFDLKRRHFNLNRQGVLSAGWSAIHALAIGHGFR
jgi:hypothetical protein